MWENITCHRCKGLSDLSPQAHYKKLIQLVEDATEKYRSSVSQQQQQQQPEATGGVANLEAGLSQASSSSGAETYYSHKTESSFGDSDGQAERETGNVTKCETGTETKHETGNETKCEKTGNETKHKPLTDTPWKIFFPSESTSGTAGDDSKPHEPKETKAGVRSATKTRSHFRAKPSSETASHETNHRHNSGGGSDNQPDLRQHATMAKQHSGRQREPPSNAGVEVEIEMALPGAPYAHPMAPRVAAWAPPSSSQPPVHGILQAPYYDFVPLANYHPLLPLPPPTTLMPPHGGPPWMHGYPVPNLHMFHADTPRFGMELRQDYTRYDDPGGDPCTLNVYATEFVPTVSSAPPTNR